MLNRPTFGGHISLVRYFVLGRERSLSQALSSNSGMTRAITDTSILHALMEVKILHWAIVERITSIPIISQTNRRGSLSRRIAVCRFHYRIFCWTMLKSKGRTLALYMTSMLRTLTPLRCRTTVWSFLPICMCCLRWENGHRCSALMSVPDIRHLLSPGGNRAIQHP